MSTGTKPNNSSATEIDRAQFALLLFGLVAPAITFVIAVSGLSMFLKTAILVGLSAIYAVGWFAALRRRGVTTGLAEPDDVPIAPCVFDDDDIGGSLSSAFSDPQTSLPNERAFFVVLENQVAESARMKNERPLSVLSIDIRDFEEICKKFGHATGDRLVQFVADIIQSQLRQMDLVTRSGSDEFNIVLPTANAVITAEIASRIKDALLPMPFEASEDEAIKVWLNFGAATFGTDGESAEHLLLTARQRRLQEKTGDTGTVFTVDRDYLN